MCMQAVLMFAATCWWFLYRMVQWSSRLWLFCTGTGKLATVGQCTADVIGLDWHTGMADARQLLGSGRVLQGNVDPMILFAPEV